MKTKLARRIALAQAAADARIAALAVGPSTVDYDDVPYEILTDAPAKAEPAPVVVASYVKPAKAKRVRKAKPVSIPMYAVREADEAEQRIVMAALGISL